jgi:import inner membrane translocase subunit TIM8
METEQQKSVIQQAIAKLTETCFEKCVNQPGKELSSSERNCIANCAGRYLDSSVFVVNRMMAKRQQNQGGGLQ